MRYALAVYCLALFSVTPAPGHDDKQAGNHRDVYITGVNGNFISTTDENLRLFSKPNGKSNILTANEDELINVILLIPRKWDKGKIVELQIYNKENGKIELLGGFPLHNYGKTVEVVPECDSYVFSIRKKYFDQSMILFNSDTESIYLHLYPNPNKKANTPDSAPPRKSPH